jgi:hypothetical protein
MINRALNRLPPRLEAETLWRDVSKTAPRKFFSPRHGKRVTVKKFPKFEHSPALSGYHQLLVESFGRVVASTFPRP